MPTDSLESESPAPNVVRCGRDDHLDSVVDDPSAGGTYVLVFELPVSATIEVGALGDCAFPAGYYAYVGSALGPGGFGRAERHTRQLAGVTETVHWHIDALTTHPETTFVAAYLVPEVDVECLIARRLPRGPLDGFGSSDCDCRSHLSVVTRETVGRTVRASVDTVNSS